MISYLLIAFGVGLIAGGIFEIGKKTNHWLGNIITDTDGIDRAKEIANSLSHKINLFLQTIYQASIRLKIIISNFPVYIRFEDKYIQLRAEDISVDDEEDIIIDGSEVLKVYEENK